jgi:hypothetical protein
LNLSGGYVWENSPDRHAHAWYALGKYKFDQVWLKPEISYRRSEFSQSYDPLSYGYSGEWGTWYQGEIVGEYMLFNSNEKVDLIKFTVHPSDTISVGLLGYRFQLYEANDAGHKDFAHEVDAYVDWKATPNLTLGMLYGYATPQAAAEDTFGMKKNSQLLEVLATLAF